MGFHACPDCGLLHGDLAPQTSPEVEIARIQAESAFKIAQLQARADRHVAEVEAESELDVATVTADAIVAAVTPPEPAEDAETIAPPVDPAPAAVLVDNTDVEQPEVPAPPVEEHDEKPKKKSGLGMWGA